jgi:hypothetical protein
VRHFFLGKIGCRLFTFEHLRSFVTPSKTTMEGLDREDCIAFAIYELQQGKFPSARQAATAWKILSAMFDRRFKGGLSRQEAHAWQQKIAPAEESALVKWCQRLSAGGYPVRHDLVRRMATYLIN